MQQPKTRNPIDRWLAKLGERSARRLTPDFPFSIRLDHPATSDLSPRYGFGKPSHPGLEALIESREQVYAATLGDFARYFEDLGRIPVSGERSPEPCWINPWLIGMDTVSLYSFTRIRRPARYVEIGSGQSTKVVARARRDGGTGTVITSIDPHPRSEVDGLCDRVMRSTLEEADLEATFGGLEPGDIVFFDGSHRLLPNSDCVAFFLDVLPALPPGILVGIHDIYLPDDYPQAFMEIWWSEQYVLAAILLAGSSGLEVALPTFWASGRPELASVLDPLFGRPEMSAVNRRGSLFWLETVAGAASGGSAGHR